MINKNVYSNFSRRYEEFGKLNVKKGLVFASNIVQSQ